MRITKRTNIAVRLLMYCALNEGRLVTKSEIAQRCNISENHLAQVVNQLSQLGFLKTQRGRNGGLNLSRSAADICIGDVFRQVEGGLPMVECFADVDNTLPFGGGVPPARCAQPRRRGLLQCARRGHIGKPDLR